LKEVVYVGQLPIKLSEKPKDLLIAIANAAVKQRALGMRQI
jgi:hypothetical protein